MIRMKIQKIALAILALFCASVFIIASNNAPQQQLFSEQVFFCPEDNCAQKLVQKINASKESIHTAVYSFTSAEIADALVEAKNRGVEVKVVTDYVQAAGKYSKDEMLQQEGIEIRIKKIEGGGSMHDKFMVIDNKLVATGSFNYTANADEKNDENLVFLANPEIIAGFKSEFLEIWQQARES